ncbi:MAG TPA: FtsX-like permease family protein [Gemmatimonadales bacterium]|nr:FtsX-like permease family protein [Gemmatimonadales bacterium]
MIRPSLSTAKFRLRASWKSVALMVALGGGALGVLFMAQSFSSGAHAGGAPLSLSPIRPVGDVLRWTADHREASAVQVQALDDLLTLFLGVGWVALASALVTIISRAAGQSAVRRGDVAVRRAVGASRGTLRLSLLFEVGAASGLILLAGLGVGLAATRAAGAAWPGSGSSGFAPRVAFLLIALAVVVSIVLWVSANLRENIAHQDEGEVPLALPAGQLGFGMAILVGGSLILGRASGMTSPVGGAAGSGGSVIPLELADSVPKDRSERYRTLLDNLAADESIEDASLTNPGAHAGLGVVDLVTTDCGQCPDGTIILQFHSFPGLHEFVSPDTFKARGIHVLQGRGFTMEDDWNAPRVAVVSRHLAYRHFQGGDAVGRDIFVASGWPARPYKVIGIVDDAPSPALGGSEQPLSTVYLGVLQHPPAATELVIRPARGDRVPQHLDGVLSRALGPHFTRGPTMTQGEIARGNAAPIQWFATWFGLAGWVILAIAVVGTFTMLHLWVRSRSAELGLRRAVGATRSRVYLFVLRRTMIVAVGGVALGLFLFASLVRPSFTDLFADLPAWNLEMVIRLSLLLAMAAFAGSILPTWRILRSPPAVSSQPGN